MRRGEIFGLLGPNGGGKTTLFRIISTLLAPSRGRARIAGHDVVAEPDAVRRRIGVVFQSPSLDGKLTVRENMRHQGHLYGLHGASLESRIDEMLGRVRMRDRERTRVEQLSGGLKRRVDLAKGLMHRPDLVLLDEPTTGLDPAARLDLWSYVLDARERDGLSVLITTHLMEDADRCDRLLIIDRGRIVALDTPERLRAGLGRELVELRVDSDPAGVLATLRSRGIARDDAFAVGTSLTVPLNGHTSSEAIAAIQELGLAAAVSARQPTLDDVYLRLTGGRLAEAA